MCEFEKFPEINYVEFKTSPEYTRVAEDLILHYKQLQQQNKIMREALESIKNQLLVDNGMGAFIDEVLKQIKGIEGE